MPLKFSLKKQGIYLAFVFITSAGIYGICDYYLHSIAKELMQSWISTEQIAIQEGNLLTAVSKTQRSLVGSDYIKSVQLVKIEDGRVEPKIEFGARYSIGLKVFENLQPGINQFRTGVLQERVIYPITNKENMYLVFDVYSQLLMLLFFISAGSIILMVVYLIVTLQRLEKEEFKKREDLLKLAINELLTNGEASKVLENEMPGLIRWWTLKKNELLESKKLAAEQQGKALLGEMAAKAVHDIRGSLRNIKHVIRTSQGLADHQKSVLSKSIEKISKISQDMLSSNKQLHSDEESLKEKIRLKDLLTDIVSNKNIDFQSIAKIDLEVQSNSDIYVKINPEALKRSLENLIDNAVEASEVGSKVSLVLSHSLSQVFLKIIDQGKGISESDLTKFGLKGFTSGKEDGNGLGVYYAKRLIEDNGGRFIVESKFNQGTTVELQMPLCFEASEASLGSPLVTRNTNHKLVLKNDEALLILEDQKLNQHMIRSVLEDVGLDKSKYFIFSNPIELERWISENTNEKFKLYSDYYLETESGEKLENGLQVIKRLGLIDRSILFTSAFDEQSILDEARSIGVKVISKDQFFDLELGCN